MAENKKSFIFYSNWINTFKELPKDKGYDLLMHILAYVNDENPQTDDILIRAVFANIKDTLKADLKKWEKHQQQRIEAGKRSAEVRKRNATSVNERSVSSTVNVNGNVNVNDNVTVNDSVSDSIKETTRNNKIPFRSNVLMTQAENERLVAEYGESFVQKCYDILSDYKTSKNKTYKSDNHVIRNWVIKKVTKEIESSKSEITIEEMKQRMLSDSEWIEVIKKTYKCNGRECKHGIELFYLFIKSQGNTSKKWIDAKSHFSNWMNKGGLSLVRKQWDEETQSRMNKMVS